MKWLALLAFAMSFSALAQDEITLPKGFSATVIHPGVGRARHLAVRDNGDIYVRLSSRGKPRGIVGLRDADGDGSYETVSRFGKDGGTGIRIHGDYLYYSTDVAVFRLKLGKELVPQAPPESVVTGFDVQNQHAAKSLALDGDGHLYVNVGAPANACQEKMRTLESPGMQPCPLLKRHGGIWRFAANRDGQTQDHDGYRYATGLRNAVALAWNPVADSLYFAMHGRDQLHQLWPKLFTDSQSAQLPAEEFHKIHDGSNLGWPYTYYDWQINKRMVNPEYGGDGHMESKATYYQQPILAFPGHWAPNGLLFYSAKQFPKSYYGGAFIAFHGSWNRAPEPQDGYRVVFVPMDKNGKPSGQWSIFADGFFGPGPKQSPGQAKHRPMGLAQGPKGSLFIADSVKGTIWKVSYAKPGA